MLGCAVLIGASGCDDDGTPEDDGGVDAGGAAGVDAGPSDEDGGPGDDDAGPGATDAGTDAGPLDPCAGVDCTGLDDDCNVGTCDPATGMCAAVPVADDTACDDADACTTGDVCAAGVCGGAAVDCSAMDDVCAVGTCNPADGMCMATPVMDATACDDGFVCTSSSACASGVCVGTGLACTAAEPDLSMTTVTMSVGGGGGSAVMMTCPAGQVLTGLRGEIETGNGLVDRPGMTNGVCSTIAIDAMGAITTTEASTIGPFAAGDDPPPRTTYTALCPANQVVVGFSAYTGTFVFQLTLRCAPLSLGAADAGFPVLVGTPADITPVGAISGSVAGPVDCAAGEVAAGIAARAGAWIDSWSLGCTPIGGTL